VGAGPVGLVLAMDLAWRGVRSTVLERRSIDAPAHPKCNTTSARTMEILRRLGCADKYRQCGLPAEFPNDVVYSTRVAGGYELARLHLPGWGKRWTEDRFAFDGGWPSAERPHRASQIYLEQVLRAHAATFELIDLRFQHEVDALTQRDAGVDLQVRDIAAASEYTISAQYAVGCDGGRSTVRRLSDIQMSGAVQALANVWAVFIRSPEILRRSPQPRAWMNWINNAAIRGTVIAIDGEDLWLVHCTVPAGVDPDSFDWRKGVVDVLGFETDFEVLIAEKWRLSRAVADSYHAGRVFLAGDAAHSWPPFAGFGMNAGIEDATGLGWMLAAVQQGWASERLLDAYDAERRPIGEQVSRAAEGMVLAQREITNDPIHRCNLEDAGPTGVAARAHAYEGLIRADSQQFDPKGLNFGIHYDASPIILYDGEEAPALTVGTYEPTTVPGCRAPHFVLSTGQPLFDMLGPGFTLLRSDPSLEVEELVTEAGQRGVPLKIVEIGHEPKARSLYQRKGVLVRPDQYIAWRADDAPPCWGQVLRTVLGDTAC